MTGCGKIARPTQGIGAEKLTNDEIRTFIRTHAPAEVISKLKKVMKRDELCAVLDLFSEGQKLKGTTSTNTLLKRLGRSMAATRIQRTVRKALEEGRFHMMNMGPAAKVVVPTRVSMTTGMAIVKRNLPKRVKMPYKPEAFANIPLIYRNMVRREAMRKETGYVSPKEFGSNSNSNRSQKSVNGYASNGGAAAPTKGGNLRPRQENLEPMGQQAQLPAITRETAVKKRRRAPTFLNFPTFYSSLSRVPSRSEQTRSTRLPLSKRQKKMIEVKRQVRRIMGSNSNNRSIVEEVRREYPEVRKTIGVSLPPNRPVSPRRSPTKRTEMSNMAIKSRLINMMYHMNSRNLGKMSPKDVRLALAKKMEVEPNMLPKKILVEEMNRFMKMNMSSRNKMLKVGEKLRQRPPKRFNENVVVSRVPTQFYGNANGGSKKSNSD